MDFDKDALRTPCEQEENVLAGGWRVRVVRCWSRFWVCAIVHRTGSSSSQASAERRSERRRSKQIEDENRGSSRNEVAGTLSELFICNWLAICVGGDLGFRIERPNGGGISSHQTEPHRVCLRRLDFLARWMCFHIWNRDWVLCVCVSVCLSDWECLCNFLCQIFRSISFLFFHSVTLVVHGNQNGCNQRERWWQTSQFEQSYCKCVLCVRSMSAFIFLALHSFPLLIDMFDHVLPLGSHQSARNFVVFFGARIATAKHIHQNKNAINCMRAKNMQLCTHPLPVRQITHRCTHGSAPNVSNKVS